MQLDILELENILNQEIDVFSELEKYTIEKKQHLINSDIENLRSVDIEIEKLSVTISDLELKKSQLLSKTGKLQDLTGAIEELVDKEKASTLTILKNKIKDLVLNIYKQNNINAQLIEHSLKLIEQTVLIITNTLMPETSAYNSSGKVKKNQTKTGVSSIIQEA